MIFHKVLRYGNTPTMYWYKDESEMCLSVGPRGNKCVLPKNHEGTHASATKHCAPEWKD